MNSQMELGHTNTKEVFVMDERNIDLGEMKSRDLGNLISKTLVEIGKEVVDNAYPNGNVDYGNLPSRALPELGKQAFANQLEQESTQ